MGLSYSTAKWLAPASFAYDFACQQYGIFASPNMVDRHNQNMSFWSPQAQFIGAFFGPQQIAQLFWLYRLYKLDAKNPTQRGELDQIVNFVPYYALGNVCIGTWMFFWNQNRLDISNIFVCVNSFSQLFYIATQLQPMNTNSTSSILTHVVSKTFAGIGVLDFLHNTSAAFFKDALPSTTIKVLTGLGFAAGSAMSDWIFGGCLVYDLVALAVGQRSRDPGWSNWLSAFAVGSAAIVTAKNLARPPYNGEGSGYERVAMDDVQDRV